MTTAFQINDVIQEVVAVDSGKGRRLKWRLENNSFRETSMSSLGSQNQSNCDIFHDVMRLAWCWFYHFWCLNTSPAWGRYVSTNRMMQYGWWSLRHFLLTCEIVIYWIRFYHFVLLCIVFVVLKYNEGETLILLLYIHRIFYLFIVIFYRKYFENTCDKITVVSLALYMYIAYYLSPAIFLSRF